MNATETRQNAFQPPQQVKCEGCPVLFTPKRSWQKFCGDACRRVAHKRKTLGPEGRMAEIEQQVATLVKSVEALKASVTKLEKQTAPA